MYTLDIYNIIMDTHRIFNDIVKGIVVEVLSFNNISSTLRYSVPLNNNFNQMNRCD